MSVQRYLKRLDGSLDDKAAVVQFIPRDAEYVLDVGCASGHVTGAMAAIREDVHFHGIDVELPFVGMAQNQAIRENTSFSHNWLSDLQKYNTKYDAITFMSVLHEFYSYGKGITSVVKALCDAYELLNPEGVIIIRDMMRPNTQMDTHTATSILGKIEGQIKVADKVHDYNSRWGFIDGIRSVNDCMLHLLYQDNWHNEIREKYMFWTAEEYINFGTKTLGMELVEGSAVYLLDYVRERWRKELWLNQMELDSLYSTGVVALRK